MRHGVVVDDEGMPLWPETTKAGRRAKGLVAGAVAFALVAFPLVVTLWFAGLSFTGGWEDTATDPSAGFWWLAVSVLLVSVPVVLGLVVAKVRSSVGSFLLGAEVVVGVVVLFGWLFGS